MFHGTKVRGTFAPDELKFHGSESSLYGLFASGNESAEERKGLESIIYINDLPEICEQFARIYLFADDAKVFEHVICDEDHKALQLGLNALQDWSNKWLLQLNILKCKTVFFGRNINKN